MTAESALRPVEHVKKAEQNITTERMPHSVQTVDLDDDVAVAELLVLGNVELGRVYEIPADEDLEAIV